MRKSDIIDFFNQRAAGWDALLKRNEEVINKILDSAQVLEGKDVLDVACGTGVLIPDYLERKVKSVTAIDIAPEMIKIAKKKFQEENVEFICGDVETEKFGRKFDCIVVYNAFPHFSEPEHLIQVLTSHLKEGGTLTIAHGMSKEQIDSHHIKCAAKVSNGLMSEEELAKMIQAYMPVTVKVSNHKMYQVTGCCIEEYVA